MIDNNPSKKRVALYVDSLKIGGAERITLTFARWCAESGWTPIVLTRQGVDSDFYPIPNGVQRAVEPQEPSWLMRFGRWGFPWRVVRLRHWLRSEAIDLAIGMTTKPSVKLLLAARPLDVPCVVSERNYPPLKRMTLPWGILRRFTYAWASLHLVRPGPPVNG
jgi:UDP-N-acetylglucosamine:LPS N-acetylglucosamine transferase